MKLEPLLEELENAAAKLDVKVSYEALGQSVGSGGLCRVKGQLRIIVDKRATVSERIATLARSLAALDATAVFLSPAARDVVERYVRYGGDPRFPAAKTG